MVLAIVFHCLGRSKNANDDDDDDDDELRVRNMTELVTFVRTKIYAARTSRGSSSYGSISAARADLSSKPTYCDSDVPTDQLLSFISSVFAIVVKFGLFIIGLKFMNFIVNNIKFIKSKMHITACIMTYIFNVNVPC